ncbi:MAG: hypothetical protein RBS10_01470 [Thauera propionica]|jgi:hypothetical protein|nr:hypothetical protein [Thauera propionica]
MMAVYFTTDQPGSCKTAAGAHLNMVQVRGMLLGAGLTQVAVAGGYDATETGTDAQVPLTSAVNTYSAPMWFAFSDALQSSYPVYIRVDVGYGDYWRPGYTTNYGYAVRLTVSDSIALDGFAKEVDGLIAASGVSAAVAGNLVSDGSFCQFRNGSLTIIHGFNSRGANASYPRSHIFAHVYRGPTGEIAMIDQDISASVATRAHTYRVFSKIGDAQFETPHAFSRFAGTSGFSIRGVGVASPVVFRRETTGDIEPIPGVFTFPGTETDLFNNVTLDFTGEERTYRVIATKAGAMYPGYSGPGLNLLIETDA